MSDHGAGRRRPVSATDAAFVGFTLARREPLAFIGWTLLYLLSAAANIAIQFYLILPTMTAFAQAQADRTANGASADPAAIFAGMGEIWRANLIIIALAIVFTAVINTAVYRAILTPKKRAFAYLRLGLDELRQLLLLVALWLVMACVYVASFIAAAIVAVVLGLSKVADGGGWARVGMILAVIACVLLPLLIIGLKLSFAGPMTFAERRVTLFASWRATPGRFWTLLGAYVASAFVLMVVGLVFMIVVFGLGLAISGGFGGFHGFQSLKGVAAPEAMRAMMLSPLMITWMVLGAPLGTLWLATVAGVPAFIYAQGRASPDDPDRSHSFGSPPAPPPNPPEGDFPITTSRHPPPDEL